MGELVDCVCMTGTQMGEPTQTERHGWAEWKKWADAVRICTTLETARVLDGGFESS